MLCAKQTCEGCTGGAQTCLGVVRGVVSRTNHQEHKSHREGVDVLTGCLHVLRCHMSRCADGHEQIDCQGRVKD